MRRSACLAALAVVVGGVGLSACIPPNEWCGTISADASQVRLVAGDGYSYGAGIAAQGAASWNATAGDQPAIVVNGSTGPTITWTTFNDGFDGSGGYGSSCQLSVTFNSARQSDYSTSGRKQWLGTHELGHALGLGHDPYLLNDSTSPIDCAKVATMFWRLGGYIACPAIASPTGFDMISINEIYLP